MSRFVTRKMENEQKQSYRQENIRSAIRLLLVALMFVVIFINYDRLRGIDIRNLIAQADSPTKAIVVVLLVYILKSATMVIPASVVNIAVGLSFPTWLALILNFIGSVMELVIAYGIGVFAGGENIRALVKRTKYGRKLLNADPKKTDISMTVIRLMPFLPIDLFSLFYGNIKYDFKRYMLFSLLGVTPGTILFTILGYAAYKILPPISAAVTLIILAVLIAIVVLYKTYTEIYDRHHPPKEELDAVSAPAALPEEAAAGAGVPAVKEDVNERL